MIPRTSIEYKNGDRHISVCYCDKKPIGFYVVESGDRNAILTADINVKLGEEGAFELLSDLGVMLSDLSFMIEKIVPATLRNAEKAFNQVGGTNSVMLSWGVQEG